MDLLYLKHRMVGTPLESLAESGRGLRNWWRRWRRPELREICLEEGRIQRAMQRLLQPDSNCIDVGAHIGSTLALIRSLAPCGEHWAFEAIDEKAAWLRRKFPSVHVRQLALSDAPGTVDFHINLSRPGFSGVGLRQDKRRSAPDQWRIVTVPTARLDDVIPTIYRLDFLKIDVEGGEARVLRGARRLLTRCRPAVLFESSPGNARRSGISHAELFNVLAENGYEVFLLRSFLTSGPPLDLAGFEAAQRYPFSAFNFLALPAHGSGR